MIGNDQDSSTFPSQVSVIQRSWESKPFSTLLTAKIATEAYSFPSGVRLITSGVVRVFAGVFGWIPDHLLTGLFFLFCLLLNFGACIQLLSRLQISWLVTVPLSLAFAITPYVRARAIVHPDYAYFGHLAAAFCLLILARSSVPLIRSKSFWSSLLLIGMSSQYYWPQTYIILFISGLCGLFISVPGSRQKWAARVAILIFSCAVVQGAQLIAWDSLFERGNKANVETNAPAFDRSRTQLFLETYRAHAIDFFTSDLALGTDDVIGLKQNLNQGVLSHLEGSNPWERTNGVRWTLGLLALCSVVLILRSLHQCRNPPLQEEQNILWLLLSGVCVGIAGVVLSLGPSVLIDFLLSVSTPIRVLSRFGILVHFAIVLCVALGARWLIQNSPQKSRTHNYAALILSISLFEYFPINPLLIAPIRPNFELPASLQGSVGMLFPAVTEFSGFWEKVEAYHAYQRNRSLDYRLMAEPTQKDVSEFLQINYGSQAIQNSSTSVLSRLPELKEKLKLRWLVCQTHLNPVFCRAACEKLNFLETRDQGTLCFERNSL